jgi:hypothetical protein
VSPAVVLCVRGVFRPVTCSRIRLRPLYVLAATAASLDAAARQVQQLDTSAAHGKISLLDVRTTDSATSITPIRIRAQGQHLHVGARDSTDQAGENQHHDLTR